jgi:hypothetical protein
MSENGGYRRLEIGSQVRCGFCLPPLELRSIKSHFGVCPGVIEYVEMYTKVGKDDLVNSEDVLKCRRVGKDILDKALVKAGDITTCAYCKSNILVLCMSKERGKLLSVFF